MSRIHIIVFFAFLSSLNLSAQKNESIDIQAGLVFQKTQHLYWENGIGADLTSDFLFHKKIHLKATYLSSRFGSAIGSNAIRQDQLMIGADWHFRSKKNLQILTGLNTGFFKADYGNTMFDVLPDQSMLLSVETGLNYRFRFPVSTSLTVGYNLINGDGVKVPGSLFPVFYRLNVYYCF